MTDDAVNIRLLAIIDLAVTRGDRQLFTGLNARLEAGEAMALTGANGAGKTSLLRVVAGMIRPVAGTVAFEGPQGPLEPDTARAEGLHVLAHQDGLKPGRTAREELEFWSQWMGGSGDLAVAVDTFSLAPLMELEVRKLSAGQRRRLALARLIAAPRKLWLLDEPMAPLDTNMRARFGEVMKTHLAGGGLILAAVHDALPLPTRSLDLGGGR